jgi:hypothetical protein
MSIKSILSNSQPAGGTTAQQPVPANATPGDIEGLVEALTPVVTRFRQQATPMVAPLNNTKALAGADSDQVRIANVGLGYKILLHCTGTLTLANTGGGAVVSTVSTRFPFNLIKSIQVQINGGAMVYSAGGVPTLQVEARKHRGFWITNSRGGFGPGLDPSRVFVQVSANGTVTNAGNTANQLSGIASISNAIGTTTITLDFFLEVKLALDEASLLGALPLQNNSTFATLTVNTASTLIGASLDDTAPVSTAGAVPGTFVATLALTVKPVYRFWSVPSDAGLYQEMVSNSYQVIEQPGISVGSTGANALTYNIPQNQYLVAAHINAFDGTTGKAAVPMNFKTGGTQGFTALRLQYNAGSVIPVNEANVNAYRALQFNQYGGDYQFCSGYMVWDGEASAEHIANSDQAAWVDTYSAASPQLVADLGSTITTPVTVSITRESVVAGAVQVVGG